MSPYKVMVDDNFHYMDEEERWEHGTFSTAEEAVAACRKLVDEWLAHNYKPGMTADELYDHYTAFGDDPFIVASHGAAEGVLFWARVYARERPRRCAASRTPAERRGDIARRAQLSRRAFRGKPAGARPIPALSRKNR